MMDMMDMEFNEWAVNSMGWIFISLWEGEFHVSRGIGDVIHLLRIR